MSQLATPYIGAVFRVYAQNAAAVETAFVHGDVVAVLEPQNAAGAVTGLPCVTGGEAGEGDVAARLEGQNVGVAGDGGDGVSRYAAVIAADGQIVHTLDDQLGAVKFVQPVVIVSLGGAVAGGGAEVVQLPVQHDIHIGADGSDQLVHRGNVDFQLLLGRSVAPVEYSLFICSSVRGLPAPSVTVPSSPNQRRTLQFSNRLPSRTILDSSAGVWVSSWYSDWS